MSAPTEVWNKWEGRVVDGRFPLRQWLGGSDHSAVFLTERAGAGPQKAAIKLIRAENDGAQLSRWAESAKLSHPHLLPLLEYGRGQIDDTPFLYVVMEYAEENLAEIIPLRPLSPDEARAMLLPAAEGLRVLHQAGFGHGRVKPANIMAVDNQLKISIDGLGKAGEPAAAPSLYDAPEIASTGLSTAGDVWSLGQTLLAVLTQVEPVETSQRGLALNEDIPQPLRGIVRECLHLDPQRRCTAETILNALQPGTLQPAMLQPGTRAPSPRPPVSAEVVRAQRIEPPARRWLIVPIVAVALFLAILLGSRLISHSPAIPAKEANTATAPSAVAPAAQSPATKVPAPFTEKEKHVPKSAPMRGSVRQQVMPGVSQSALRTIDGTVKIAVRVDVDSSGNVTQGRLSSAGPSKYFANLALAAARQWKFNPPQVNGQAVASEWMLRFQLRRTAVNAASDEIRP